MLEFHVQKIFNGPLEFNNSWKKWPFDIWSVEPPYVSAWSPRQINLEMPALLIVC